MFMVIGAVLLALVVVGLLYWFTTSLKKNARYSVFSWVLSFILFVVLSFENVLLFNAIDRQSYTDDIASSVGSIVEKYLPEVVPNHVLTKEEAHLISLPLKIAFPSASKVIKSSDFEGHSVAEIVNILSDIMHKFSGRYIGRLIGMIAMTVVLIGFLIIITLKKDSSNYTSSFGSDDELEDI